MTKKLLVVVAVLATIGISIAGQSTSSRASDEAEIRRFISSYASARQSGDGPAQAQFFAEDADEWRSVTRKMVTRRAQLAKDVAVAPSASRKFSLQVEAIQFVAPNIALVDASYYGNVPARNGHATFLLVGNSGSWLIRSARIFRYPEAQP